MILFINTSQTNLIQVKLIDAGQVIASQASHEQFKQSELLLNMVDKVVGKKKLTAVAVVSGPGAFSALRFGITTANTLAWSLKIPVVELNVNEVVDDKMLIGFIQDKTKSFLSSGARRAEGEKLKAKKFIPVVPKYGSEPNITSVKGSL